MVTEENRCLVCNNPNPPKRCPICKSNSYYRDLGITVNVPCNRCGTRTRLHVNRECKSCLRVQGLKECSRCKQILPELLSFNESQGACKKCRRPLGHLTPLERRRHRYLSRYGITLEDYEAMVLGQEGMCGICGESGGKDLYVDHDHSTRKVRGLLCHSCNVGLGHFRDRTELLRAAIDYLENSGGISPAF